MVLKLKAWFLLVYIHLPFFLSSPSLYTYICFIILFDSYIDFAGIIVRVDLSTSFHSLWGRFHLRNLFPAHDVKLLVTFWQTMEGRKVNYCIGYIDRWCRSTRMKRNCWLTKSIKRGKMRWTLAAIQSAVSHQAQALLRLTKANRLKKKATRVMFQPFGNKVESILDDDTRARSFFILFF
jgi:hypothetical protein